jgi:hypothetical protein
MGKLERGECNLTVKKIEETAQRIRVAPIALYTRGSRRDQRPSRHSYMS